MSYRVGCDGEWQKFPDCAQARKAAEAKAAPDQLAYVLKGRFHPKFEAIFPKERKNELVCPRCGEAAGTDGTYCPVCGLLWAEVEFKSRAEWEVENKPQFLHLWPAWQLDQLRWPLEKLALGLHALLLRVSGFWLLIDKWEPKPDVWDRRRSAYVLAWAVVLAVMWALNPGGGFLKVLFAILAIFRLLEVLNTALGTALERPQQARARSLVTIAIYGLQLTFLFAILDHSLAGGEFAFGSEDGDHATHAFDYLYISWTDMATVGNDYLPLKGVARGLEMATTSSGILLLGVLVALGISRVQRPSVSGGATSAREARAARQREKGWLKDVRRGG